MSPSRHPQAPPPGHAGVPKSVKHLVLAAALADLCRWLAGLARRLQGGRPPERGR